MATNLDAILAEQAPSGPVQSPPASSRSWWDGQTYQMNVKFDRNGLETSDIIVDIIAGAGNEFIADSGRAVATGTNSLVWDKAMGATSNLLGTDVIAGWVLLPVAADQFASFPQTSSFSATAQALIDSTSELARLIAGIQSLRLTQASAAANTNTVRLVVSIRLLGMSNLPTVIVTAGPNLASYKITGATFSIRGTVGVSTDAFQPATFGIVGSGAPVGRPGAFPTGPIGPTGGPGGARKL